MPSKLFARVVAGPLVVESPGPQFYCQSAPALLEQLPIFDIVPKWQKLLESWGQLPLHFDKARKFSVNLRNFVAGVETVMKKRVVVKKEKAFYLERANKMLTLYLKHI